MKYIISLFTVLALAVPAFAENVSFDPNTPEGRKAAYAALNEQSTKLNINRTIKGLKSYSKNSTDNNLKAQIEDVLPKLEKIQSSL